MFFAVLTARLDAKFGNFALRRGATLDAARDPVMYAA